MAGIRHLVSCMLLSVSGCATESIVIELAHDESVTQMAASGDTLAIGVAHRERYDRRTGTGAAAEERSAIALIREGAPAVRTPLEPGVLRALVPTPSGFAALRVARPRGAAPLVAQVFLLDMNGKVTALTPLQMDLLGLWVTGAGEVFAYSVAAVMRWAPARAAWSNVPLDPVLTAGPIMEVAPLNSGAVAVVNERAIMGFTQLDAPPVFVRDMNTYPYPLQLHGGGDRWWLVLSSEARQKLVQVAIDGAVRDVATLSTVNVQDLIFDGDRVIMVCSREGGDVHKTSFYVLDRAGDAPMRGPHMLPVDTTKTSLWRGAIVSGGPMRKVSKTSIPR